MGDGHDNAFVVAWIIAEYPWREAVEVSPIDPQPRFLWPRDGTY